MNKELKGKLLEIKSIVDGCLEEGEEKKEDSKSSKEESADVLIEMVRGKKSKKK